MSDSSRPEHKKMDIFATLRGFFGKNDDEDNGLAEVEYEPDVPSPLKTENEAPEDIQEIEADSSAISEDAHEKEDAGDSVKHVKPKPVSFRTGSAGKPEQKEAPAAEKSRPAAKTEENGGKTGSKLGSIFGKFVEIITQPEDGSFAEEEDDVLDDIFADDDKNGVTTEIKKAPKSVSSPKSLYKEKTASAAKEKPEPVQHVDEDEEISFAAAEPAAKENEKTEEPVSTVTAAEPAAPVVKKTEITIDAIMQAKNSAVTKTPMTYKAAVVTEEKPDAEKEIQAEEKTAPENPSGIKIAQAAVQGTEKKATRVKVHAVPKNKKSTPKAGEKPLQKTDEKPVQETKNEFIADNISGQESKPEAQTKEEKTVNQTEQKAEKADEKPVTPEVKDAEKAEVKPEKAQKVDKKPVTPEVKDAEKAEVKPEKAQMVDKKPVISEVKDAEKAEAKPEKATEEIAEKAAKQDKPEEKATKDAAAAVTDKTEDKPEEVVPESATLYTAPVAPVTKPAAVKPAAPVVPVAAPRPSAARPVTGQALPKSAPRPVQKPAPKAAPPVTKTEDLPRVHTATVNNAFAQARPEPMVYHTYDGPPFLVMAGKFSKTIRAEYEAARKYRALAAPQAQSGPAPVPAPVAQKSEKAAPPAAEKKQTPKKADKKSKSAAVAAIAAGVEAAAVVQEAADEAVPKVKPARPPIKMPKKKKTLGSRISGLFSMDDEFDENPDEEDVVRPELEDYNSVDEADEIRGDINENLRKVFVRTVALTVTTSVALIAALLAYFMPALFTTIIHHGWLVYALINLAVLLVSVYFDRFPIYNGLMSLLHFKGDSDTAAAVAVVAATIQSIFALFLPDVFVNGTYHIYVPLVILALLLNSVGKLLIVKRTADNFRFLCKKEARYAGKIYTNIDNAEKLVRDLPSRKPIIAYMKRSDFMSNFLRLSYAVDPVEDLARIIAPFTACLCLLCGIAYGAVTKDVVGGVSSFALTSVITIPMCALLAINIPMKNLSGSTLSKGAMLASFESVKQFSDTNTVMLDYTDLYPKGSIILSGIKAFSETKIQDAILAGAAVTFAVNGPMTYIFETMIQDRQNMLPKVESVTYDDNMGLSGWIGGQRILIGNRELLKKHNITPPNERLERKYRKMGNEISYISVGGELVAMFIMTYKVDRNIAEALRELEDNGVSFVVRTIDPNITSKHIAEKFSLYNRCVTVLRTGLGTIAYDEISGKEKTTRAYLVTNGKIEAFANAVSGCIKMKSTVTISKIIQMMSIVTGFVLVNILSFFSGFAKLGVFELLLYIGFWCIALIAVSIAARTIS